MNNNNDFFKGFSALDDEDKISAQNNSNRSDGRKEPTFGSESIEDSVNIIGQFDSQADSSGNAHENNYDGQMRDSFSGPEAYEANKLASNGNTKDGQNSNGKDPKSTNEDKKASNSKKNLKRKFLFLVLKAGIAALVLLSLLFVYFDSVVLSKFGVDDKWVLPAVVYSRPLELYPDQKLSLEQMEYELKLLKYRKVNNPQLPGEYAVSYKTGRMIILRRPFEFAEGAEPKLSLLLVFNSQRVSQIINADTKEELGYVRMDPVLLDRINRIDPKEDRIFIQLSEVPNSLITTLLEIEDRSFRTNLGVNFFAIIRAFIKNTIANSVVEGGSTITQQLVKNYFLNSQRSYTRKIKEIIMALIMNHRYTKDQILEAYLNEIYLGQNGSAGIYGFGLASYFYFGVPVSELTQDQMALLVGIIKGPSYYDPWRHPEQALERRNVVLAVLKNRGHLTQTEYEQYKARPLGVIKRGSMNYSKTPAFMGVLKKEIASRFGPEFLSGNGIKIFTSLDPQAQQAAEIAVQTELNAIEKERRLKGLEAAMVVSSWRTAEVSAVVGSRTPQYEGFNRVMEGKRQVGSIIKPFVYLTAFHNGIHTGTLIHDAPITVKLADGKKWQPHNDDKKFHGNIPTYVAMARSMNVPTVKIGMRVGLNHVRETLLNIGIDKSRIPYYPSMLLGTVELTPFEVTQIYTSLVTDGSYKDLTTLRSVVKDGKIVYERANTKVTPTLDPRDSYLTLFVMTEATRIGTGRRIGRLFPNVNVATKTGTTNDSRDTWSVGIDSDQVVATWVGFDNNRPTGLFGSSGAMRVYAKFLKERGVNSLELKKPEGVKFVNFNRSGNIVADSCMMPGLTSLPVRVDKVRYVDQNCTIIADPEPEVIPYESND
ncbi:MAG: penicillin-binding protein 1B [Succinivibrio sp.]